MDINLVEKFSLWPPTHQPSSSGGPVQQDYVEPALKAIVRICAAPNTLRVS